MKTIILTIFLLFTIKVMAQVDYTGAYYLKGVAESSGFQLKPDSTFLFFFSYGGLDRTGTGTWMIKNNRVILNSRPYPGSDFRLLKSEKSAGDSIVIKISDKNAQLLNYVYAGLFSKTKGAAFRNNAKGLLVFTKEPFDGIALSFAFSPEHKSVYVPVNKTHTYFEFAFEEWMMEVFFKDFSLAVEGKTLKGNHPLYEKGSFVYEKEE